jgi:hypothetical protein
MIQANFVLAASREAVPDSEWNRALLTGVSRLYVEAIQRFCATRHRLAFEWMQYWPHQNMEGIWDCLRPQLRNVLVTAPVLYTRSNRLASISHLRSLPEWFLHDGTPLVPDTTADVYLAKDYTKAAVKTLHSLGLVQLSYDMILERIKAALGSLQQKPLDDAWHDTFAEVVRTLRQERMCKSSVDAMDIIPLEDNCWVSPNSITQHRIYLPLIVDEDAVKIRLPKGLKFRILHPTAAAIGERLTFYNMLGVCSCDPKIACGKIIDAHNNASRSGWLSDWLGDFEILFWFGERFEYPVPSWSAAHSSYNLFAYCPDNKVRRTRQVLMPSDKTGDAENLLARTPKADYEHQYGFLNSAYLSSGVRDQFRHGCDWKSWLLRCGIRAYPSLLEVDSTTSLNMLLKFAARDNSEVFLDGIKEHWRDDYCFHYRKILSQLQQITVQCRNGSSSPLKDTVLPTKELLEASSSLRLLDKIPFLKMSGLSQYPDLSDWGFLRDLGVTCEPTYEFYLIALRLLGDGDLPAGFDVTGTATIIYGSIGSSAGLKDSATLRVSMPRPPKTRLTGQ